VISRVADLIARARQPGGFAANVLVLFSWVVVAQGLTMLVMPLLTRLYHPDQFGIYSLFVSGSAMIAVVAALRYEYAIVLPESERDARALVWGSLLLAGAVAALTWIVGAIALRLMPGSQWSALRPWLGWFAAAVFLTAAYSVFMYWALREKAFKALAASRVVIAAGMAGVQLAAALFFGPYTALLIAAMVIGQAGGVAFLVLRTGFPLRERATRAEVRGVAQRYVAFPKYSALSSLLNAVSSLLPVAMLTVLFSPTIAGLFAVADKVVRTPSVLFGSSLQQVFYQRLAESRADGRACRALLLRTWRYLVLLGIIPMAVIFVAGPWLFSFVFGAQWHEAGVYGRILTIGLFVHFIAYPTTNGIVAFERQGVMLSWDVLYVLSLAAVFGIGGFVMHLSARHLLVAFAVSQAVVHVANLGAQWKVLLDSTGTRAQGGHPQGGPADRASADRDAAVAGAAAR